MNKMNTPLIIGVLVVLLAVVVQANKGSDKDSDSDESKSKFACILSAGAIFSGKYVLDTKTGSVQRKRDTTSYTYKSNGNCKCDDISAIDFLDNKNTAFYSASLCSDSACPKKGRVADTNFCDRVENKKANGICKQFQNCKNFKVWKCCSTSLPPVEIPTTESTDAPTPQPTDPPADIWEPL
jgi:hypothetical protein